MASETSQNDLDSFYTLTPKSLYLDTVQYCTGSLRRVTTIIYISSL